MQIARFVILLMALTIGAVPADAKKKKKEAEKTEVKAKTEYQKIVEKEGVVAAKSDFLSLYRSGTKLYVEVPMKYIGRAMLLGSTTSQSSNSRMATVGYKEHDPLLVTFEQLDSSIVLSEVNAFTDAVEDLRLARERNYRDVMLKRFKIEAWNADSTAVLLDMTKFFTDEEKSLKPVSANYSILAIKSWIKSELTALGNIKAFADNVSVETYMTFEYSLNLSGMELKEGLLTTKVTRTLLLLPEDKMKPRINDTRLGFFLTQKRELSTRSDGLKEYSLATRWRLEPSDSAAWAAGELVRPKKPIVWYVDDAFPSEWKEPLKRAVTFWNTAFERIGFRDAMEARDFPKDDPEFDPDNLKYSCIRYVPTTVQNAMGPSWVDPRTGEIINASVMVYNDVIKLINKWRFVQTAQVDPRVRTSKMPADIVDESMEYVFAHEIGHTLGLMHNMAASNAYPVDSLRSASFTRVNGTTPSIMDYARFNYVAQPGDEGVSLTPPGLGVYDYFAIKWLYSCFPAGMSVEEEAKELEKWVDEKDGNRLYRYGRQQFYSRYDPSSIEEDLGDDAIKAGEYGIKNLKYILSHISEWITDDASTAHRQMLYAEICSQYGRYLDNVLGNVGGIYLTAIKDGSKYQRQQSVPRDVQRQSLLWVIDQLRGAEWINAPELTCNFPLHIDRNIQLSNSVGKALMARTNEVLLSSHISTDGGYTQREYLQDLYDAVWAPMLKGKALTTTDRLLQEIYVKNATIVINKAVGRKNALTDEDDAEVRLSDYDLQDTHEGLPCNCVPTNAHVSFGDTDWYGLQSEVRTDALDESLGLHMQLTEQLRKQLRTRLNTLPSKDRAHYRAILSTLESLNY